MNAYQVSKTLFQIFEGKVTELMNQAIKTLFQTVVRKVTEFANQVLMSQTIELRVTEFAVENLERFFN